MQNVLAIVYECGSTDSMNPTEIFIAATLIEQLQIAKLYAVNKKLNKLAY